MMWKSKKSQFLGYTHVEIWFSMSFPMLRNCFVKRIKFRIHSTWWVLFQQNKNHLTHVWNSRRISGIPPPCLHFLKTLLPFCNFSFITLDFLLDGATSLGCRFLLLIQISSNVVYIHIYILCILYILYIHIYILYIYIIYIYYIYILYIIYILNIILYIIYILNIINIHIIYIMPLNRLRKVLGFCSLHTRFFVVCKREVTVCLWKIIIRSIYEIIPKYFMISSAWTS